MKIKTYSRRSKTVSTVKKSQATTPSACAAKNCDHVGPDRRGDGSMPALFKIAHTVEGASRYPSVGGHEKLPSGGHKSAHWWPTKLPSGGQVICPR